MGDEVAVDVLRIDEMGHAEARAPFLLGRIGVDADDHVGAGEPQPLHDIEADAAEAEDDGGRAFFDLRRIEHGADAGGDAAADIAGLVEGRVVADLGDRDLRQDGEIGEGRAAHIVVERLAVEGEARRAVGHDALALGGADRGAQIGLARQAGGALPAFRRIERDDVVALLDAGDARPDIDHDAGAFMAENGGKEPFRIGAGQGEFVGVADAGRLDLDQHLEGLRPLELHRLDAEWLAGLEGHRRAHIHSVSPVLPNSERRL